MKKRCKKLCALLLIAVMGMLLSATAFAQDSTVQETASSGTENEFDGTQYLKDYCELTCDLVLGEVKRGQHIEFNITVTNNGNRTIEKVGIDSIWRMNELYAPAIFSKDPLWGYEIDAIPAGESATVKYTYTILQDIEETSNGKGFFGYALACYNGGSMALYTDAVDGILVADELPTPPVETPETEIPETEIPETETPVETPETKPSVEGTKNETNVPKTGDPVSVGLMGVVLASSGAIIAKTLKKRK